MTYRETEDDYTVMDEIVHALHRIAEALERENEIRNVAMGAFDKMLEKHLDERGNPVIHMKPVDPA